MNLREMALSPGRVDALDSPRLRLSVELQSPALRTLLPRVTAQIDWHSGPRAELRPLFELADDSRSQLDEYSNWAGLCGRSQSGGGAARKGDETPPSPEPRAKAPN